MSFSADINEFVKKAGDNQDKFMREFIQDISEQVIINTPVDTGFLRSSWTGRIGSPDTATTGQTLDANAASALASDRIALSLIGLNAGETYYINNNADYAQHVEFGTSNQQGAAMVRKTINKARTIAKQVLQRISV